MGKGFLDASSHLYMRVCPSVRPYVTRFFEFAKSLISDINDGYKVQWSHTHAQTHAHARTYTHTRAHTHINVRPKLMSERNRNDEG